MHEYHGAGIGGGRPERREPVVAEIAAADAGRYLDAPQPRQRHEVLKLGHGQREILKRDRAEPEHAAVGAVRRGLRQALVLDPADPGRERGLGEDRHEQDPR